MALTSGSAFATRPDRADLVRRRVVAALADGSTEVSFAGEAWGPELIDHLATEPRSIYLTSLDLSGNHIGDAGVRKLADAPWASRIETLDLSRNWLGDDALIILGRSKRLRALRRLRLNHNTIGHKGVAAVVRSRWAARLTHLDLGFNALSDRGAALLTRRRLPSLVGLSIPSNQIGARGIEALIHSGVLTCLEELALGAIGDRWPPYPLSEGKALYIGHHGQAANQVDAPTAAHLALHPMPALRALDLSHARLSHAAMEVVLSNPTLTQLRRLGVSRLEGAKALTATAIPRKLTQLEARGMTIDQGVAEALSRTGVLRQIQVLDLIDCTISADALVTLVRALADSQVRTLRLGFTLKWRDLKASPAFWAALARLRHLRALTLVRAILRDEHVERLVSSGALANIEYLDLSFNDQLGPPAALAIAFSGTARHLRGLNLRNTSIDSEGAAHLARSPHLGALEHLDVRRVYIGPEGAQALLSSRRLHSLRWVGLGYDIGDRGLEALLRFRGISDYRSLDLADMNITLAGLRMLVGSSRVDRLVRLDVSRNELGKTAADVLADSRVLCHLGQLKMSQVGLTSRGLARLLSSACARRLSTLDVADNRVGGQGVSVLAWHPPTRLTRLSLSNTAVEGDDVTALVASRALPALTMLDINAVEIWDVEPLATIGFPSLRELHVYATELSTDELFALLRGRGLRRLAYMDARASGWIHLCPPEGLRRTLIPDGPPELMAILLYSETRNPKYHSCPLKSPVLDLQRDVQHHTGRAFFVVDGI